MPSKLLVPLDGSVLAESAVPWAACLARAAGHSIVLAQAVPWPLIASEGRIGAYASPDLYDDILNAECEEATSNLSRVRAGLLDQGLQVEVVVRAGAPATAVLDIVDETGADLVVMATHGRGGLPRLVLGSFASYVVQHATVPVMLMRPQHGGTAPLPSFERLVVPLDGSELAERALELATGVARSGATLVLVRIEESETPHRAGEPPPDEARAGRSETFGEAARYLQQILVRLAARGLRASTDIRRGRPAEQILAAARAHDADVIVMATHGRSGPARRLLGSVADEVVRHADRPILLVTARTAVKHGSAPRTIGDLLTGEPVVVRDDESLAVVLRKLLRQRTPVAAVVNGSGNPVGLISERGLSNWHDKVICELAAHQESPARDAYTRRAQAATASTIMTPLAPVLDASTPIDRATHLLRERGLSHLPVMRDGKLVGILTTTDILKGMSARLRAEAGVEGLSPLSGGD